MKFTSGIFFITDVQIEPTIIVENEACLEPGDIVNSVRLSINSQPL